MDCNLSSFTSFLEVGVLGFEFFVISSRSTGDNSVAFCLELIGVETSFISPLLVDPLLKVEGLKNERLNDEDLSDII